MKFVILACALAGCAASPDRQASSAAAMWSCPATPAPVPVPPAPRNLDAIVAWGNAVDERRAETAHALDLCRAKLKHARDAVKQEN